MADENVGRPLFTLVQIYNDAVYRKVADTAMHILGIFSLLGSAVVSGAIQENEPHIAKFYYCEILGPIFKPTFFILNGKSGF